VRKSQFSEDSGWLIRVAVIFRSLLTQILLIGSIRCSTGCY
jgi:hypothetical protein